MTEALWDLCQNREDYRALWDSVDWKNLPKAPPVPQGPSGADRLKSCAHRGRSVKGPDGKVKMHPV